MINWHRVRELQEEIGAEDFAEVAEIFLDEVDEVIERIQADASNLGADFHFLKGGALNLGFEVFAAQCAEKEREANAGKPVDIAEAVDCYTESKTAFLTQLEGGLAA